MSEGYRGLTIPSYADAADAPAAFKDLIDSGPIARFADATARDAALTSPTEGEHCYLLSSSKLQVYDGLAWVEPYLPLGGGSLSGQLDMANNKIINIGSPTLSGDAVTLGYLQANYDVSGHTHAASDVNSGILAVARIPDLDAAKITTGAFAAARIPSLDASKITTGTVAVARLPDASTSAQGVVQLSTSQTTTSTTTALTAGAANAKLQAHTGTGSQVIVSTSAPSGGQNGDIWLRV